MVHIVIIGNGIAGNALAFGIRKFDRQSAVTIIAAENSPEYDPGALPYYVGGNVPRKEVFLKKIEDYRQNEINLLLGLKAAGINTGKKKVYVADGSEIGYDKLVIATGGNQIVPPIKGIDKEGVYCCKNLADADSLAGHNGKTAVVIGSGLIGIEASEALKRRGYEVYLIELLGWIMPRVFDAEPAKLLADSLIKNGIKVLTNEKVLSVNGENKVSGVTTDKRELKCDTVVLATGVVPASELAREAGIETAASRGIKVNERMMTSVEDVYACGDCVETKDVFTGENVIYQLRHNALEQAEVIAKNCLGFNCTYRGAWNFTRAHFFDTHAVSIGKTLASINDAKDTEVIEKKYDDNYYRLVIHNGKLAGAQAIGKSANNAGILLSSMWRGDNLTELKSQWHKIQQINSPYPWSYRIIGRYMSL